MVSPLGAALHPSPSPSPHPGGGSRARLPTSLPCSLVTWIPRPYPGHQGGLLCRAVSYPIPLRVPLCRPPLPPSGTSRRGRNWAGNRLLTATWGPCQDSLPLAPLGLAPHRPLQGNQGWGRGKALKGTRTRTWARTPGRGLGLGPQRPPGQLHPAGLGVSTGGERATLGLSL